MSSLWSVCLFVGMSGSVSASFSRCDLFMMICSALCTRAVQHLCLTPLYDCFSADKRFLFPEGVKALGEAVNLIAKGEAPKIVQPTENASYDPLWKDPELAQVNFQEPSITIHNFIRGNDRFPGAWAVIMDERTTLFGSSLVTKAEVPEGRNVEVKGRSSTSMAVAAREGLFLEGSDGGFLRVSFVKRGGQIVSAGDLYDIAGK